MAVVKMLSFDNESVELLESLAKKLGKKQSELVRELIKEKAKELGLEVENSKLAEV